tara:strand:- start:41 stop:328 length:288 start_codon:yes stop_codon:yes gene_type:complete
MDNVNLMEICTAVVVAIVGYFLNRTIARIDGLEKSVTANKEQIAENASKTKIMQVTTSSKITRLDEKFDVMQLSIENLTKEIKELNATYQKTGNH